MRELFSNVCDLQSSNQARITPIELARLFTASSAWTVRSAANWGKGATETRADAIAELRRSVAALPPLETSQVNSDTSHTWNQRRREVRRYLISRDPSAMLTWTPIVRTMTFGFLPWLRAEFNALSRAAGWKTRWRDALHENRAGLPMPSHVYLPSSGTLIHHAYHLHRFTRMTGEAITDFQEIIEFGGGYGSMARLITRLGFRGRYHIHDLPEFSALQRFYLRSVRAEVGEGETADALSRISYSSQMQDAAPTAGSRGRSLFIATWSLGETPTGLREEWLVNLARFRFFLIGFRARFEEIDNLKWFNEFAGTRPDVEWRLEPIRHRGAEQYYLFGTPS